MAVAWPAGVNQDAYGMDTAPIDNTERVEFESGKARTYLKNTAVKKIHSFMLSLNDEGPGSEYKTFVAWWDTVLLGSAMSFYFPDLVTHTGTKEYRMVSMFSATGQRLKEVSLSVEEM